MLQKYGNQPLTRETVARQLLTREYYQALLDDSQYDPNDPYYIPESDTREARERRFNEAVDRTLEKATDPKASIYVEKIEQALQERSIPVVRCDGPSCTGVLNPSSNVEVEDLEYKDAYTKFSLKKEK
jgi:predicted RNA-binding protein with PUA-like domain